MTLLLTAKVFVKQIADLQVLKRKSRAKIKKPQKTARYSWGLSLLWLMDADLKDNLNAKRCQKLFDFYFSSPYAEVRYRYNPARRNSVIQIIGLRPYFNTKKNKEDVKHEFFGEVSDLHFMFANISNILGDIDPAEHWNLYYTALDCPPIQYNKDGKPMNLREFKSQKIIPFDVDHIDKSRIKDYITLFLDFFNLEEEKTAIVFSGNGLQFIVELPEAFTDAKFFEDFRPFYKMICKLFDFEMKKAGLSGELDPAVFTPARILRFPCTENRKKSGVTRAELLQGNLAPQKLDLKELSGIPEVAPTDAVDINTPIDVKALFSDCDFFKWTQTNPADIHEPQFYAALSFLGRAENGEAICQKLAANIKTAGSSSSVANYSPEEVTEKIEQALRASGPRTCKNISNLWEGCTKCPHYQKINSPASLKSAEFIGTEKTGFHNLVKTPQGIRAIPNYKDLRKFFENKEHYKTLNPAKIVYTWNGTHYEFCSDIRIANFAQEHFNPYAKSVMRNEFKDLVFSTNLTTDEFFKVRRKINFANGVLDIDSGELIPHNPDLGFRYVLPYNFDPSARAPRFSQFLQEVTSNNEQMMNVLMEFAGYALSDDKYWIHKALILTGEGANGKSVFLSVIKALAGDNNYTTITMDDLEKEASRQLLDGRLFNVSEETPQKSFFESALFKNLTGDGETVVRMLYKSPYMMKNSAKLMFSCNELPRSFDSTRGFFRRLILVPFDQVFEGERDDKGLKAKLFQELPGIFNMALEGYRRLQANKKFTDSKIIEEKIADYALETDTIKRWFGETVHVNGNWEKYMTVKDLYFNYKNDMEQEGFKPLNIVHFGRGISKLIPDFKDRAVFKKINRKSIRVLLGVTLEE